MPHQTATEQADTERSIYSELINLRTRAVTYIASETAELMRKQREPLIACQTITTGRDDETPERVYRMYPSTGPVDEHWPQCKPTELYFRSEGDPEPRFGQDVPDNRLHEYSYAGWLPLGLITHPDGRSDHHACTAGDIWITNPAGTQTPRPPGQIQNAVTAADCLKELTARAATKVWQEPHPETWPWSPAKAREALETITRELATAAAALDYELRVQRNHEKTANADCDPHQPKSRTREAAARLRQLVGIVHDLDVLDTSTIPLPDRAP